LSSCVEYRFVYLDIGLLI